MFKLSRKGADQKTVPKEGSQSRTMFRSWLSKIILSCFINVYCALFFQHYRAHGLQTFTTVYGWTWNLVSSYHAAAIAKGSESRQTRMVVQRIYCKQKALNCPKPKVSPYRWCLLSAPMLCHSCGELCSEFCKGPRKVQSISNWFLHLLAMLWCDGFTTGGSTATH
jgi:hypothetical protein